MSGSRKHRSDLPFWWNLPPNKVTHGRCCLKWREFALSLAHHGRLAKDSEHYIMLNINILRWNHSFFTGLVHKWDDTHQWYARHIYWQVMLKIPAFFGSSHFFNRHNHGQTPTSLEDLRGSLVSRRAVWATAGHVTLKYFGSTNEKEVMSSHLRLIST